MTNTPEEDDYPLKKVFEELKEEKGSKIKPKLELKKEKRLQYYSGWNKKEKEGKMEEEIGRIKKSDTTDVVIRVDEFKGEKGVTIREYLTSEKYTGFTKNGTRIPADKWEEFKELVNKVKLEK
jgi:hypothetical protein